MRRWEISLQRRIAVTDAFVVAMVMVISHGLRFGWDPLNGWMGPAGLAPWWSTVAISTLWLLQLSWTRSRDVRILGQGPEEYQRIGAAGTRTFALVAIVAFFTQWGMSRGYLLFSIPLGTLVLFAYRRAWRAWIGEQRCIGNLRQRVIIAGPHRVVEDMVRRLRHVSRDHSYDVAGVCLTGARAAEPLAPDLADVPVLGVVGDAAKLAERVCAEYIVLAGSEDMSLTEARRLEWELEDTGVGLIVAPTVADVAMPRVTVNQVAGLPLMYVDPPRFAGPSRVLKDVADKAGALALLLVLAVPMLIIAIAIKRGSEGPVFYRQERVGVGHQPFPMIKFRSMYTDADRRRAETFAQDDGNGVLSKRRDDPRITDVGRFLRRHSLDELPQLFNVLRGEMSLVGPRPPLPSETELWDQDVARRQMVKPGLTGLWQVSGRSDLTWEESVRLDLHYTHNWSLGLDAVIMLRTVWAVLGGRGAY
ncbi:sugar transferase [Demequina subtropica]|uniref:sugar transferase n=1 Tax=Demequina subtropica TaxID=1638989 RepID=UPI0007856CDA|nr:sugar transferase [Demequina subtropica]